MIKQELKTGMILEFNNGDKAMVLLNTNNGDIFSGDTWSTLDSFNDNLEFKKDTNFTYVIKIYQPKNNIDYLQKGINTSFLSCNLIWEKSNYKTK